MIQTVKEKSKVPVIETGVGNCHIYVDDSADLEMAVNIVVNAKTQRPSVCNAAESLVVHEKIAEAFLPKLEEAVAKVHPIEFRADQEALRIFKNAVLATEEDYSTEFLDYIMSVKTVKSVEEAVDWINGHTTHHSEAIVTQSIAHAEFSKKALMRRRFMSMRPLGSPTALFSDWARKLVFPPKKCTPAALWVWKR